MLEPFATLWWQMDNALFAMTEERLLQVQEACQQPTSVNCWYATYRAAEILKPMIERRLAQVRLDKKRSAASATSEHS